MATERIQTNDYPSAASTNWLLIARAGWYFAATVAIGILLTSLPGYLLWVRSGLPGHGPVTDTSQFYITLHTFTSIISLASSVLSIILSVVLFRHKFSNPAVAAVSFYLLIYGIVMAGPMEAWGLYWVGHFDFAIYAQSFMTATPTVALLVLFPNGEFIPRWSRWVLIGSIPFVFLVFILPISPGSSLDPLGWGIMAMVWVCILGLGFYAQAHRFRHVSNKIERQQTKWVLFGFALWFAYLLVSSIPYYYLVSLPAGAQQPWWSPLSELTWWLSLNIVPITLAIAITRSRLWNIDVVINRALVYGILTIATMLLYIFVVGALGNLLNLGNSSFIAFLTTGLIAVLFQPLRERLQRWINRMMYGERDDPVSVLSRLGSHIERTGSPEDALASIVETVARALKLPYVAIKLGEGTLTVVSYGLERPDTLRLPLTYQSETSGYLVVAPRATGEAFSASDWQLLETITHQAGAAAHAARLTNDLRLSRQRLITTREEERRRLRRDLHDGLGPTLASLTLKIDAIRNLMSSDPGKAGQLLDELKTQTQGTIQDIRSLVYELRPPALDDLGLIGALNSFIDKQKDQRTKISLSAPKPMPQLPAAIEVAVYRIVIEGLSNVLRHADASSAEAIIALKDEHLVVEVHDNGVGIPDDYSAGVGLASMQERAEELGGTFEILNLKPGFHICARLPNAISISLEGE